MKEEILKEFDEFIGESPEIIDAYKDDICFVCGQPFNKSPQFKELKEKISQSLDQYLQSYKDEVLRRLVEEEKMTQFPLQASRIVDIIKNTNHS